MFSNSVPWSDFAPFGRVMADISIFTATTGKGKQYFRDILSSQQPPLPSLKTPTLFYIIQINGTFFVSLLNALILRAVPFCRI